MSDAVIRLLLADDQALVRGALAALLNLERDLEVVAEVVTTFGRPGFLRRALQAGAHGFVVKDTPATELADAVRKVHQGLRVVDPQLATDSLVAGESPLTPRETEVLRAARDGSTVAAISKRLFLSEGTVRNHLSAAIGKTGATTRAEAVLTAEGNGWL